MTKASRLKLKRDIAQAYHNLDRALAEIQAVHEKFEPVHADYAEYLEKIAQVLLMAQSMLQRFWELAWGKWPENIDTYRG